MIDTPVKLLMDLGVTAIAIFLLYRLADKWAGEFLQAQQQQARAMADLAAAVREGHDEQREILLAVRVAATKVDELMEEVRGQRAKGAAQ